jgi:hypothetical protein
MEITEASISSPDSKMFFRCLLMAGSYTPNNSASVFCVSETVSFLKKYQHSPPRSTQCRAGTGFLRSWFLNRNDAVETTDCPDEHG